MIRGTTPQLEFTLPFDTSVLKEAHITFSQFKRVALDKTLQDCTCSENILVLKLTQEETLALKSDVTTEIQIRVRTNTGDALASNIITVETGRILKDGVI